MQMIKILAEPLMLFGALNFEKISPPNLHPRFGDPKRM